MDCPGHGLTSGGQNGLFGPRKKLIPPSHFDNLGSWPGPMGMFGPRKGGRGPASLVVSTPPPEGGIAMTTDSLIPPLLGIYGDKSGAMITLFIISSLIRNNSSLDSGAADKGRARTSSFGRGAHRPVPPC